MLWFGHAFFRIGRCKQVWRNAKIHEGLSAAGANECDSMRDSLDNSDATLQELFRFLGKLTSDLVAYGARALV